MSRRACAPRLAPTRQPRVVDQRFTCARQSLRGARAGVKPRRPRVSESCASKTSKPVVGRRAPATRCARRARRSSTPATAPRPRRERPVRRGTRASPRGRRRDAARASTRAALARAAWPSSCRAPRQPLQPRRIAALDEQRTSVSPAASSSAAGNEIDVSLDERARRFGQGDYGHPRRNIGRTARQCMLGSYIEPFCACALACGCAQR